MRFTTFVGRAAAGLNGPGLDSRGGAFDASGPPDVLVEAVAAAASSSSPLVVARVGLNSGSWGVAPVNVPAVSAIDTGECLEPTCPRGGCSRDE